MHSIASKIANYSVDHGWIESEYLAHCCYALEKRLELGLFLLIQLIWSIPFGKAIETLSFVSVILLFRGVMGGIHASSPASCQVLSSLVVLFAILLWGPLFELLPYKVQFCVSVQTVMLAYILKPAIPLQMHFTQTELRKNISRKNVLLLCLAVIQWLSSALSGGLFMVYSTVAIQFVILTVLMQIINSRRKGSLENEKD